MRTAAPCYEYATAVERICHPSCSVCQHRVLIISELDKTPQNSQICEHERPSLIFFEY